VGRRATHETGHDIGVNHVGGNDNAMSTSFETGAESTSARRLGRGDANANNAKYQTPARQASASRSRQWGRATLILAVAAPLAVAGTAPPQTPEPPRPPNLTWSGVGQRISTPATSWCWASPDGTHRLCADDSPPSCTARSRPGRRLLLPKDRRVTVNAVLGFKPSRVVLTLVPRTGKKRTRNLTPKRGLKLRVPRDFEGAIRVFAISGDPARPGDAHYGACLVRVTARIPT